MHLRSNKENGGGWILHPVMRKIFAKDVRLNCNPKLTRCCLHAFVFAINITHSIVVAVHRSSTVRVASWHRVRRGRRGWDATVTELATCVCKLMCYELNSPSYLMIVKGKNLHLSLVGWGKNQHNRASRPFRSRPFNVSVSLCLFGKSTFIYKEITLKRPWNLVRWCSTWSSQCPLETWSSQYWIWV